LQTAIEITKGVSECPKRKKGVKKAKFVGNNIRRNRSSFKTFKASFLRMKIFIRVQNWRWGKWARNWTSGVVSQRSFRGWHQKGDCRLAQRKIPNRGSLGAGESEEDSEGRGQSSLGLCRSKRESVTEAKEITARPKRIWGGDHTPEKLTEERGKTGRGTEPATSNTGGQHKQDPGQRQTYQEETRRRKGGKGVGYDFIYESC